MRKLFSLISSCLVSSILFQSITIPDFEAMSYRISVNVIRRPPKLCAHSSVLVQVFNPISHISPAYLGYDSTKSISDKSSDYSPFIWAKRAILSKSYLLFFINFHFIPCFFKNFITFFHRLAMIFYSFKIFVQFPLFVCLVNYKQNVNQNQNTNETKVRIAHRKLSCYVWNEVGEHHGVVKNDHHNRFICQLQFEHLLTLMRSVSCVVHNVERI